MPYPPSPRSCAAALALLVLLAGCAAADDGEATATPSTGTSMTPATTAPSTSTTATPSTTAGTPTTTPDVRTIAITVTGRTVTPAPAVVELASGEVLRLVVTTDHDDELHAHGFEVERPLVAGTPTTIDLTGKEPGRYEVETHEPALRLLVVQVR